MITAKINNQKYRIPPISQLEFWQFNKIFVVDSVFALKEYISLFIDMGIDDLMAAKIDERTVSAMHAMIFDVDIGKQIKSKPLSLSYNNQIYIVDQMRLDTFGKTYIFALYYDNFQAKKITLYELSLYCVACHISESYDMKEIEAIYSDLSKMRWTKILPAAFFLLKNSLRKKEGLMKQWAIYTWELKRMRLLSTYRTKLLSVSQRRLLRRFW